MSSLRFTCLPSAWRAWLLVVLALAASVRAAAQADGPPPPPPPVDIEQSNTPPPAPIFVGAPVGIFEDVQVRAHETAEQAVAIGGDLTIEGRVQDNAVSVFGHTRVSNRVGGNLVSVFGDITLDAETQDNVVSVFGQITLGPRARIHGNAVAVGGRILRDPAAEIHGQTVPLPIPGLRHFGSWVRTNLLTGRLYPHDHPQTWVFVGIMLGLALLSWVLFRDAVEAGSSVLARRPTVAFVYGILTLLLAPPAMILFAATGIGILALPFLWIGLFYATFIGVVAVSQHCGNRLGAGFSPVLALVIGHLLLAALFALPIVGLLTWCAVMVLGLGTTMTAWLESRRRNRKKPVPAAPSTLSAPIPPTPATPPIAPVAPLTPTPMPSAPPPAAATAAEPTPSSAPPVEPAFARPEAPPVRETEAHVTRAEPLPSPPALPPPSSSAPALSAAATPPVTRSEPALERADFLTRLAATLLDLILVGAAAGMIGFDDIFLVAWFGYHVAFWAWRGTTLGGAVLNLRIERLDRSSFDFSVALVRALGAIMSFLPLGLGFLWVNWDPERQSWHDKIAGTVIVRVPRGQALI